MNDEHEQTKENVLAGKVRTSVSKMYNKYSYTFSFLN